MPSADRILCDVPCAGLGVIRKKPEIRYKQPGEFDKLPELQYSILSVSAQYLKVGGVLVYSTCSLNPAENEEVINKFLNEHSNFESVRVLPDVKRYSEDTDYLTLMPHIHNCDGFFISAVRKIKEV
jgi:16S rRNA (cytosine967-C5)-methyltransferase